MENTTQPLEPMTEKESWENQLKTAPPYTVTRWEHGQSVLRIVGGKTRQVAVLSTGKTEKYDDELWSLEVHVLADHMEIVLPDIIDALKEQIRVWESAPAPLTGTAI